MCQTEEQLSAGRPHSLPASLPAGSSSSSSQASLLTGSQLITWPHLLGLPACLPGTLSYSFLLLLLLLSNTLRTTYFMAQHTRLNYLFIFLHGQCHLCIMCLLTGSFLHTNPPRAAAAPNNCLQIPQTINILHLTSGDKWPGINKCHIVSAGGGAGPRLNTYWPPGHHILTRPHNPQSAYPLSQQPPGGACGAITSWSQPLTNTILGQ